MIAVFPARITGVARFAIYEDERELIVTSVSSRGLQMRLFKANEGQTKQPNHHVNSNDNTFLQHPAFVPLLGQPPGASCQRRTHVMVGYKVREKTENNDTRQYMIRYAVANRGI